jgi:antitoxin MazE
MKEYLLCIYMKTKIMKWGNSYAVRLPKHVVEDLNLKEESELTLEQKDRSITLTPSKHERLQEILKGMEQQKELEWGKQRGKEAW